MNASAVEYRDVTVTAPPDVTILDRIQLTIAAGDRVVYLGRSGAGKTTALKAVNGLSVPSSGSVLVGGQVVVPETVVNLRRRIGYVLQQPALFPHRTVYENVTTVPRLLGWPEGRMREAAETLLQQVDLPAARFGERYPRALSGGEQQRVAIARALIGEPSILLCDEPFSALDPLIRAELQQLLLESTHAMTLLFVTHDVREALRVAARVVVFEGGRIVENAIPEELARSQQPLVRRFLASIS